MNLSPLHQQYTMMLVTVTMLTKTEILKIGSRWYKWDRINKCMLLDLFTMAKSAETGSTKSSTISGKAVSMIKTIKRSAEAIAQPFKKVKQSFSTHSATHSIVSHLSTALPPSDSEADNLNTKSVSDDDSTNPEVE